MAMTFSHTLNTNPNRRRRARELISRSRSTFRYIVVSPKNQTEIHCESVLEKKFTLLLEYSRAVIRYTEQPQRFEIEVGDELFFHYPDFELEMSDGSIVYAEVKSRQGLAKPGIAERLALAKTFFEARGFDYLIISNDDLNARRMMLKNLAHLKRFRTCKPDIKSHLESMVPSRQMTFGQLASDLDVLTAWELVANQLVYCNYSELINDTAIVRPIQENDHERLY